MTTISTFKLINEHLDYANEIRDEIIRSSSSKHLSTQCSLKDVQKVAIILTAPRGGSSLFYALLSNTEQVISLNGEHTPFYKLNRFTYPFHNCFIKPI